MKVIGNNMIINNLCCATVQLVQNIEVARFEQLRYLVLLIQVAKGDVDYQQINPLCYFATLKSQKNEKGQLGRQSGENDMPNRTFTK
jgi:hypothetical protein